MYKKNRLYGQCPYIFAFRINHLWNMSNLRRGNFQGQPFHLVSPSPWPILTCVSLFTLTTTGVSTMQGFDHASSFLPFTLLSVVLSMFFWFRDVISEGKAKSLILYLISPNLIMKTTKVINPNLIMKTTKVISP